MPTAGTLVRAFDPPEQDTVSTLETTTSTSYTDLATAGPSVTFSLANGQSALLIVEAHMFISASGVNGALCSVEVAGPSSSDLAAADVNCIETGHVTEWTPGTKHTLFTASAAGAHTATLKYRVIGAFTGSFKERRLTVIPLPI
jgi:hypothetical protein